MSYDAMRAVVVLSGGGQPFENQLAAIRETWELSESRWIKRSISGPSERYYHSTSYDAVRNATVLFGGVSETGIVLRDTWEWSGTTWIVRATAGPSARYRHALAHDAARGLTVLFGGRDLAARKAETWVWNGAAWVQRMVSGPSARSSHAMAYDLTRGVTVLFGGILTDDTYSGETWEWDGFSWAQRFATGPAPRYGHAMAYDAARGVTVLFGGVLANGAQSSETWEWNGVVWTPRPISGPVARSSHAMVYDSARSITILFGGFDGVSGLQDTWALGSTPFLASSPSSQSLCPSEPASLSVTPAGSGPFSFQWRRGSPASPISGATSASYTTPTGPAAADTYDCIISSPFGTATSSPAAVTYNVIDYNCDHVGNPDDIGDYITDYFTSPAVPGPGGYAAPCPDLPPPYTGGYKAAFTIDGSPQCYEPFSDNLGDYITAYFAGV